jgi:hypothetical protein
MALLLSLVAEYMSPRGRGAHNRLVAILLAPAFFLTPSFQKRKVDWSNSNPPKQMLVLGVRLLAVSIRLEQLQRLQPDQFGIDRLVHAAIRG